MSENMQVRCFRRADGQMIEGCDRIRFRSYGTCEMVFADDTFKVLPSFMRLEEAEKAVRRGVWVEVGDSVAQASPSTSDSDDIARLRKQIATLIAERDEARKIAYARHALLLSHEWSKPDSDDEEAYCPVCMSLDGEQHTAGCSMAETIAESSRMQALTRHTPTADGASHE